MAAAAWPIAARAQQAMTVWRVGILETTSREMSALARGAACPVVGCFDCGVLEDYFS